MGVRRNFTCGFYHVRLKRFFQSQVRVKQSRPASLMLKQKPRRLKLLFGSLLPILNQLGNVDRHEALPGELYGPAGAGEGAAGAGGVGG